MKSSKHLCCLLFSLFLFALSGCSGDLTSMAQENLYATKQANKTVVPDSPPKGYQQVFLEVPHPEGNMKIHFWHYSNTDFQAPVVIHFHGNAENIGSLHKVNFLKKMEELNSHFVVVDYPGYGKSSGTPSESTVLATASKTIEWTANHYPRSPIIVWGWSLGAAVATQIAKKYPETVAGLVLSSPWLRVRILAEEIFGNLAGKLSESWYLKNEWNSLEAAELIKTNVLIHHGTKDKLIAFRHGQILSQNFKQSHVLFRPVEGKGHGDIFVDPAYWQDLSRFVESY